MQQLSGQDASFIYAERTTRTDPCAVGRDLRPVDRTGQEGDVQGDPRPPRATPPPGAGVPAEGGAGPRGPRSPVVGRGQQLRPRVPRPPHRPARARRLAAVLHPGGPPARPPARPLQAAVGDVRHRRARCRRGGAEGCLRHGAQGPPRGHRRHVRRGDDHGHPHPGPQGRRPASAGDGVDPGADPSDFELLARAGFNAATDAGTRGARRRQARPGARARDRAAAPATGGLDVARADHPVQRAGQRPPSGRRLLLRARRREEDAPGCGGGDGQRRRPVRARRRAAQLPRKRPASCRPRRCGR